MAHLHGTVLNHLFLEVITGHSCAFFVCLFLSTVVETFGYDETNLVCETDIKQHTNQLKKKGEKKHKKLSSMIWYDGISSLCFS